MTKPQQTTGMDDHPEACSPASDDDPSEPAPKTLVGSLAFELLERILQLLAAAPPADHQQALSTYRSLGRAASTCHALLECASSSWRELVETLLGEPWVGLPPARWSSCLRLGGGTMSSRRLCRQRGAMATAR